MTWAERVAHHTCHAKGCPVKVAPKYLMCPRHWRLVPADLKDAVWLEYEPGQEERMDPTFEYVVAARDAINAVARVEWPDLQRPVAT